MDRNFHIENIRHRQLGIEHIGYWIDGYAVSKFEEIDEEHLPIKRRAINKNGVVTILLGKIRRKTARHGKRKVEERDCIFEISKCGEM